MASVSLGVSSFGSHVGSVKSKAGGLSDIDKEVELLLKQVVDVTSELKSIFHKGEVVDSLDADTIYYDAIDIDLSSEEGKKLLVLESQLTQKLKDIVSHKQLSSNESVKNLSSAELIQLENQFLDTTKLLQEKVSKNPTTELVKDLLASTVATVLISSLTVSGASISFNFLPVIIGGLMIAGPRGVEQVTNSYFPKPVADKVQLAVKGLSAAMAVYHVGVTGLVGAGQLLGSVASSWLAKSQHVEHAVQSVVGKVGFKKDVADVVTRTVLGATGQYAGIRLGETGSSLLQSVPNFNSLQTSSGEVSFSSESIKSLAHDASTGLLNVGRSVDFLPNLFPVASAMPTPASESGSASGSGSADSLTEAQRECASRLNVSPSLCNQHGVYIGRNEIVSDKIFSLLPSSVSSWSDVTPTMLESITELNFFRAGLTSLVEGDLDGLTNVQSVDFSYNSFGVIEGSVLKGLDSLVSLDFSNAGVTELDSEFLSGVPNLETLLLNSNELTSVQNNLLINCPSLTYLNLSHNPLVTIEERALVGPSALSRLDLSFTELTELPLHVLNSIENGVELILLQGNNLVLNANHLYQFYLHNTEVGYTTFGIESNSVVKFGEREMSLTDYASQFLTGESSGIVVFHGGSLQISAGGITDFDQQRITAFALSLQLASESEDIGLLLDALNQRVDAVEDNFLGLEGTLKSVILDLSQYKHEVDSRLNSLELLTTIQGDQIESNKSLLRAQEMTIDDLRTLLLELKERVSGLDVRVDGLDMQIDSLVEQISQYEDSFAKLFDTTEEHAVKLETLQEQLTRLSIELKNTEDLLRSEQEESFRILAGSIGAVAAVLVFGGLGVVLTCLCLRCRKSENVSSSPRPSLVESNQTLNTGVSVDNCVELAPLPSVRGSSRSSSENTTAPSTSNIEVVRQGVRAGLLLKQHHHPLHSISESRSILSTSRAFPNPSSLHSSPSIQSNPPLPHQVVEEDLWFSNS